MRVAIVDVGSNTVRLLVADRDGGCLNAVHEDREYLGLGEEIERLGRISERSLARVERVLWIHTAGARKLGASAMEVVVTAPGRQAENPDELVAALEAGGGAPVRVLSAEEEGRLAWTGAVSAFPDPPESIAVCDVGGGSTEVVIGTPEGGPAWLRSFDVGSLRLTQRLVQGDPPGQEAVSAARAEVAQALGGLVAPLPRAALATGGTARALGKLVGPRLGAPQLDYAIRRLAELPAREITKRYRVEPARARTLPAGAVILEEVQRRLELPLHVSHAGLREGAALALLAEAAAA